MVAEFVRVSLCSLLLSMAVGCDGGGGSGGGGGVSSSSSDKELLDGVAPIYEAFEAVADNFPDMASLEPKKCESKPKWMGGMGWNSLMKLIGREPSPIEKELYDVAILGDVGRMHRLPPKGTTEIKSRSHFTEAIEEFGKRSHMAILRMGAGKATAAGIGSTFEAGFVQGWLVVFDMSSKQPVCQWPIKVQSSEKVAYGVAHGDGQQRMEDKKRYAIKQDLKNKARSAIFDAKREMIPEQ